MTRILTFVYWCWVIPRVWSEVRHISRRGTARYRRCVGIYLVETGMSLLTNHCEGWGPPNWSCCHAPRRRSLSSGCPGERREGADIDHHFIPFYDARRLWLQLYHQRPPLCGYNFSLSWMDTISPAKIERWANLLSRQDGEKRPRPREEGYTKPYRSADWLSTTNLSTDGWPRVYSASFEEVWQAVILWCT